MNMLAFDKAALRSANSVLQSTDFRRGERALPFGDLRLLTGCVTASVRNRHPTGSRYAMTTGTHAELSRDHDDRPVHATTAATLGRGWEGVHSRSAYKAGCTRHSLARPVRD